MGPQKAWMDTSEPASKIVTQIREEYEFECVVGMDG